MNYVIQACLTGFVGFVAKELISRGPCGINKTKVRRIFQAGSNIGMALAYILISMTTSSMGVVYIAVITIAISSTLGAAGEAVVPIDLTNKYSASIMAIANCVANLSGTILPWTVSTILGGKSSSFERWQIIWWILSTVLISGGLLFASVLEAEIQQFDHNEPTTDVKSSPFIKGDSLTSVIASDDAYMPSLIGVNTLQPMKLDNKCEKKLANQSTG